MTTFTERWVLRFRAMQSGSPGENRGLGGLQHTVQPAQDREGKDDFAVVVLAMVATQEISDGPDEGQEGLLVHERRGESPNAHESTKRTAS